MFQYKPREFFARSGTPLFPKSGFTERPWQLGLEFSPLTAVVAGNKDLLLWQRGREAERQRGREAERQGVMEEETQRCREPERQKCREAVRQGGREAEGKEGREAERHKVMGAERQGGR